jgi:RNA polymerase sigma-70 factor (ECF subfamily)
LTDQEHIARIRKGSVEAFEEVFENHFNGLYTYAFHLTADAQAAKEMVQQVFYNVWKNRDRLVITSSLKAYLYKSVYNETLQLSRSKKYQAAHRLHELYRNRGATARNDTSLRLEYREIFEKYHEALNQLPEQCRLIFQLNRVEGHTYLQIAEDLNISVKTVEAQMGKALRRLRLALSEYLPEK